ncbi:MAG TPA: hypothetical protein VH105_15805 [Burkholderiales bacterium]|nr:hypothetical protein [Burkholderiales bacterium]
MPRLPALIAIAAATLACAAPALAMTDAEYRTQKERVKEDFSHRFVTCIDYAGAERRKCESDLRHERNTALKDLKTSYRSSREPAPPPATVRP